MPSGDHLNVLLIVIDAGRRERFGCYGYPRGTTPVIDEVARRGVLFERMISPAPWTLPSHASLFTGLYPREHGAERPTYRMRTGPVTLAQHLHTHGYATAIFSNNKLVAPRTGLVVGVSETLRRQQFDSDFNRLWTRRVKMLLGQGDSGANVTNRQVRTFLRKVTVPFFIFINYMECHWKYRPPRPFERRFVRRRYTLVDSARQRMRMRYRRPWDGIGWADGELELLNDLYDGSLAYLDGRIGDLMEDLQASGRADDTVLIITADHGENLGDHGQVGHELCLYQSLIHVPFIARIPGSAASQIGGLVQFTDVFAGLCGVLGIGVPDGLRARPLAVDPFRLQPGQPGRPLAFAEWQEWQGAQLQRRLQSAPKFRSTPSAEAVQDPRYKLIVEPGTGTETLFDLQDDPGETRNRLADLPVEHARLREALEQWHSLFQPVGTEAPYTPEEEQAVVARLEEMGYL